MRLLLKQNKKGLGKMSKRRKSRKQQFNILLIPVIFLILFLILLIIDTSKTPQSNALQNKISQKEIQQKEAYTGNKLDDRKENFIQLSTNLEIPSCAAKNHSEDHEIRRFENYTICYRESYEQAEWSAYCISDYQLVKNADRSNDFRADPIISTGSADLADYRKSGFDRGHLTPAADMSFDSKAMSDTFFMSNMSPQNPQFNRGIWKDLEAQVRIWVKVFGRAYVVSGPILNKSADEYNSIGNNNVAIPEYFYKVILVPLYEDMTDRSSSDDAKAVAAIGFVIPNQNCKDSFWDYAETIDNIERMTNLDFYSLLPDSWENKIEAQYNLDEWK